ncbi:MAG TPA: hypothetical protein PKA16_10065 [Ottowia sp.]|uniref:hypothetical protein n=1 Tax=Ottowia sp. TaxID=1898956 RepID=UPI002CB7AEEE|nr:hypothetical protein [Ottowia sp.]HMN21725.1 hypothetical protein [Ottowia sp.]
MKRKRLSVEQSVAVLKQAELGMPVQDLIPYDDLANGYVTAQAVRVLYGVVISSDGRSVDGEATAIGRRAMRERAAGVTAA